MRNVFSPLVSCLGIGASLFVFTNGVVNLLHAVLSLNVDGYFASFNARAAVIGLSELVSCVLLLFVTGFIVCLINGDKTQ